MTGSADAGGSSHRDYDLVLLGATGFTGRLTARYLAGLEGGARRWAIAGRDEGRLTSLAAQLPAAPAVEVVDTDDLVGLLDLAARTRVLATTVGPYLRHGELVAQACVRSATHYLDVTGEPAFVDLLLARYDADARRQGIKLVSCCGFESVPADLGVRYTVGHLPDDVPLTVRGYLRVRMRPSAGTVTTALDGTALERRATATPPPAPGGHAGGRPVARLGTGLERVAALDGWAVALPTIDTTVVLRSARVLAGYGSRLRYGHHLLLSHLPAALGALAGASFLRAATRLAWTRALLSRALLSRALLSRALLSRALLSRLPAPPLPAPGDGPDEATLARNFFELTFLGEGGGHRVVTRVSGGDPGYDTTAMTLAEAARTLLDDDTPATTGVVTPAVALGAAYHRRVAAAGLGFEVLSGPDILRHTA